MKHICLTAAATLLAGSAATNDPFAFLRPWVEVSNSELRRLNEGEVVVRTLPGGSGQLVVLGLVRVKAPAGRLVDWTHEIAELKRSPFVLAIGRFSEPPAREDLNALRLDDRDLDAIRQCRSHDCSVKLAESEIQSLRRVVEQAGTGWKEAVQREFRRLLLARVNLYRSQGLSGLPPYASGGSPVHPQDAFATILANSPYLARSLPRLAAQLDAYPEVKNPRVESFFYWSSERYGAGRPVVSVTHVNIVRADDAESAPSVAVAGKQIFASHYMNGALGLTMMVPAAGDGHYLVYLNRAQLDLLGGVFGFVRRAILEGRIARDTPAVLRGLRGRLESGDPPAFARPVGNRQDRNLFK